MAKVQRRSTLSIRVFERAFPDLDDDEAGLLPLVWGVRRRLEDADLVVDVEDPQEAGPGDREVEAPPEDGDAAGRDLDVDVDGRRPRRVFSDDETALGRESDRVSEDLAEIADGATVDVADKVLEDEA